MLSLRACLVAIPIALVTASCGGSSSDVGATGDSGSPDASGNPDGNVTDSGGRLDSGSGGDSARDASNDSALTLDGNDGGGCPDVFGGYTMLMTTGAGCGDLSAAAKQCILPLNGGGNLCLIHFNSEQPIPGRAVNGPLAGVDLLPDGTFSGADLREGSVNRTGCTGSWDAGSNTMTVICGGTGTGQSCTVTMVRTRSTC